MTKAHTSRRNARSLAKRMSEALGLLRELEPAAYQQITMPACGFSALPADAIGDDTHEYWYSEQAQHLYSEICEQIFPVR